MLIFPYKMLAALRNLGQIMRIIHTITKKTLSKCETSYLRPLNVGLGPLKLYFSLKKTKFLMFHISWSCQVH